MEKIIETKIIPVIEEQIDFSKESNESLLGLYGQAIVQANLWDDEKWKNRTNQIGEIILERMNNMEDIERQQYEESMNGLRQIIDKLIAIVERDRAFIEFLIKLYNQKG